MKANNEDIINLDGNTKMSDEALSKFIEKCADDMFKSLRVPEEYFLIPISKL